jgi:uncharacterized surface protein with fasciclin (FAS1) repeats
VEAVLLYHVVPGATITYDQAQDSDNARLTTALGSEIRVNVVGHEVLLRDLDLNAKNARVLPGAADINAGNKQVAHAIGRVLRPIDL